MGKRKSDAPNNRRKKVTLLFPGGGQIATAPTQPILKESLLPLPDPEPFLSPAPVLVAQCPHQVHDPICATLQNQLTLGLQPHLTILEFNAHGCCGRSGVHGTGCAAFPIAPAPNLLNPGMTNPANNMGLTNQAGTRQRIYTGWTTLCAGRGWLVDHPSAVSATSGNTRYRISSCVMIRVRAAFPNLPGVPYRGFDAS